MSRRAYSSGRRWAEARKRKAPVVIVIDVQRARSTLLLFSPEEPLIVSKAMYSQLAKCPGLADVMDRVRASLPLPTETKQ